MKEYKGHKYGLCPLSPEERKRIAEEYSNRSPLQKIIGVIRKKEL